MSEATECRVYNAKEVTLVVGAVPLRGWADGEFVSIDQRNDSAEVTKGTDGDAVISYTNDSSTVWTVNLMQGSPGNLILSALHRQKAIFPAMLRDGSGTSVERASKCVIQKPPTRGFGKTAGMRSWAFIAVTQDESIVGDNREG